MIYAVITIALIIYFSINCFAAAIYFKENLEECPDNLIKTTIKTIFAGVFIILWVLLDVIVFDPVRRYVKGKFKRRFKR
jgi:hypothetical protein